MKLEAVIFDRDGVLVDFDLEMAAAYFQPLLPGRFNQLLRLWQTWETEQIPPSNLEEEQLFWKELWRFIGSQLALTTEVQQACARFDYKTALRPFPDAVGALQTARQNGLATAVLSNFGLASIDASLEATGLAPLVDLAAAAPVIGIAKPAAGAYQYVLQRLGLPAQACLFLDDELSHVEGARKVGLQAYLVDRRRQDHDIENGVVGDLSALVAILTRDSGKNRMVPRSQ